LFHQKVSRFLADGKLPHQLKLFLAHPCILKAGRLVDADLIYLQNAIHSSTPFVGGLDLAKFAKDRHIISNMQRCSLSNLCATVLAKRLDKNVSEHVSQAWEDEVLTPEQQLYAAKDAMVSLLIHFFFF
jgi:ribonuclease D